MIRRRWAGVLLVLALFGAACTGDGDEGGENGGAVTQRDFRFVVVTHGQASDPFWSVAANGVTAAAEDMGVEVEYQAPETFDMVAMSELIDAASGAWGDDNPAALADAVLRVASRDVGERRRAARARAEEFPWSATIDAMVDLHRSASQHLPLAASR